jgi:hypothetical protein
LVAAAKEVTVTTPIQTKREVLDLVPFVATGRQPFVVSAGKLVTVTGTGFRPTMTMALGGVKVLELKIESETSASFFVPIQAKFGITDLSLSQDGTEQTISLLYRGIKTDLPVITLTEPEVCSDYQYYDLDGVLRAGTRGCNAIAASLTADYNTCPQTSAPRPQCWRDGQIDCTTTDRFKSADTDPSEISSLDIRQGKTLGGIQGGRKFCENSARRALIDETTSAIDKFDTSDDFGFETGGSLDEDSSHGSSDSCAPSVWRMGGIDSGSIRGFCNDSEDQCVYEKMYLLH